MTAAEQDAPLSTINRLFMRAILALAASGEPQRHAACELAAAARSALRHAQPREAERFNAVLHSLTRSRHVHNDEEITVPQPKLLDVRRLIPMERHKRIFETYERLQPGESFVLINDHDPKPLYYQFEAEHTGRFSWNYLQQGPTVWQVEIGRRATAAA
ncbi:MAG TPA: DUF2249 domain-containing protein [Steroidobacteraceae bacterium]|nr:DUF2249 domain-containing protein [Steroidobacteraceae bacterium]